MSSQDNFFLRFVCFLGELRITFFFRDLLTFSIFPNKQITLEARLWSSLEQMSIIDPLAMQSVFIVAKAKLLQ